MAKVHFISENQVCDDSDHGVDLVSDLGVCFLTPTEKENKNRMICRTLFRFIDDVSNGELAPGSAYVDPVFGVRIELIDYCTLEIVDGNEKEVWVRDLAGVKQ